MIWYGLTMEEAQRCCDRMGLAPSFRLTSDPKGANGVATSFVGTDGPDMPQDLDREGLSGALKVIRAKEGLHAVEILLGCFAEAATGPA